MEKGFSCLPPPTSIESTRSMSKPISIIQSPKGAELSARPKLMVDCDLPSGKEMDREIDSMRRSLAPASSSGKQTNEEVDISALSLIHI